MNIEKYHINGRNITEEQKNDLPNCSLIYLLLLGRVAQNFGFLDRRNFKIHDLTSLSTPRKRTTSFSKKKKNAVGKLSILEPCNKQANQDGRVVNFDRVVLVDGRVILVRIMRGIQLDGHHFIDFHYRIWSGRGIDEQASRYRSTRQDLDHYNEGSAFHPPLPPSLK